MVTQKNRNKIVGVMGPANASLRETEHAYSTGKLIADEGYFLLCGGRRVGIMQAVAKGASQKGGFVIGILPGENSNEASGFLDLAIVTGIGSARNNINVLSSDIIISIGAGLGTISEIVLALKASKKVVVMDVDESARNFLSSLGKSDLYFANNPEHAMNIVRQIFAHEQKNDDIEVINVS